MVSGPADRSILPGRRWLLQSREKTIAGYPPLRLLQVRSAPLPPPRARGGKCADDTRWQSAQGWKIVPTGGAGIPQGSLIPLQRREGLVHQTPEPALFRKEGEETALRIWEFQAWNQPSCIPRTPMFSGQPHRNGPGLPHPSPHPNLKTQSSSPAISRPARCSSSWSIP